MPLLRDEGCGLRAPDVATHYFLPRRQPFLNLSELDEPDVFAVMDELNDMRRRGLQLRPFGRGYIACRRLTGVSLYEMFVAAGGQPERRRRTSSAEEPHPGSKGSPRTCSR